MSLKAQIWAWEQRVGSPIAKMILLKLADNTNDETGLCFPKQDTIAKHVECSRRTVVRNIKKLEEMHLLIVIPQYRDGKQIQNKYRLNLQNTPHLGVTESHTCCDSDDQLGVTESHTESVSLTTKSIKEKSIKKNIILMEKKPQWLPQKILNDFIEHRRQIRKPLTKIGLERLFTKLETIRQQGGDPIESINNSILSGYQGVFYQQNKKGNFHGKNRDGYQELEQANADNIRYIQQLDHELEEIDRIQQGEDPN